MAEAQIMRWDEIEDASDFKSLDETEKYYAQEQYFNEVISPQIPEEDKDGAKEQFFADFGRRVIPQDTGQELGEAMASQAAQGLLSLPKGVIGGVGAVASLVPGMEDNFMQRGADAFGKWYEENIPVSPIQAERFPVKASGAFGQGVGFLGTTLASGGLGATPAVARAIGLGTAGLMGAESGGQAAEDYGVTNPLERAAMVLGYGAAEAGTEAMFGFGTGDATKALLGQMRSAVRPGRAGTRFLKTATGEAVEEPIAGQAQDWLTQGIVEEDANKPGYALNGRPLPPDFLTEENLKNRLEEAALGAVGGTVFAGAEAAMSRTPVNEALALRFQARSAMSELETKQDRTPEEEARLAELQAEDQNLSTWLERQGQDRIRTALDGIVSDPASAANEMARAAEARQDAQGAAFWRSEAGVQQMEQEAASYGAVLDNLRMVEADPQATPEDRKAAQEAVSSHVLNQQNPYRPEAQDGVIRKAWDEKLQKLKQRVQTAKNAQTLPQGSPEQVRASVAPVAQEVASSIADIAPDIAEEVESLVPQPTEIQENATPEITLESRLQEEPQGGVVSQETQETGAGGSLLGAAPIQEEVTPPPDETSSTQIQPVGQLPVQRETPSTQAPSQTSAPTAQVARRRKIPTTLKVSGRDIEKARTRVPKEVVANVRLVSRAELATDPAFKAFWMGQKGATEEGWQTFLARDLAVAEGLANDGNGNLVIFPEGVVVNTEDVANAGASGRTAGEQAITRLLFHENWHGVEKWLRSSKDKSVKELRNRYDALLNEITPEELDDLAARRYQEFSNWRNNKRSKRKLQSEVMAERREAAVATGQPDGLVDRFMAWLRDVWMKVTNAKQEPTGDELDQLFEAWRRSQSQPSTSRSSGLEIQLSLPELPPPATLESSPHEWLFEDSDQTAVEQRAWDDFTRAWQSRNPEGSSEQMTADYLSERDYQLSMTEVEMRQERKRSERPLSEVEDVVRLSKPEGTIDQRLSDIASYFDYAASRSQEEGMDPAKATEDERVFMATGLPVEMYRRGTDFAGQKAMAKEAIQALSEKSLDGRSITFGKDLLAYMNGTPLYGLPFRPVLASRMASHLENATSERAQLGIDIQEVQKARQRALSQSGATLGSARGIYQPLQEIADKSQAMGEEAMEKELGIDDAKKVSDQINKDIQKTGKENAKLLTPDVRAPLVDAAENNADDFPLSMEFLGPEQAKAIRDLDQELAELEADLQLLRELEAEAGGSVAASKPETPRVTIEELRKRIEGRKKKITSLLKKIKVQPKQGEDEVSTAKKEVAKAKRKSEKAAEVTDNTTFKAWVLGAESAGIDKFDDEMLKYLQPNGFNREAFTTLLSNKFREADPNMIGGVVNRIADLLDGVATEEGIAEDQKKAPNYDARAKRIVAKSLGNNVGESTLDPLNELTKRRLKGEIDASTFQSELQKLGITDDTAFALSRKVDEDIASRALVKEASKSKKEREKSQKQAELEVDSLARKLWGEKGKKVEASAFKKLVESFKKFQINEAELRDGLAKLNVDKKTQDSLANFLQIDRSAKIANTWNTIRENASKARQKAIDSFVNSLQEREKGVSKKPQPRQKMSRFARLLWEASNSGILDSEAVTNAFAEAYELHGLTSERLKELGEVLQAINLMREGMTKETLLNEFNFLLQQVAPTANFVQFSHQALMGFVLSGLNTMAMQLTGVGRFLNPLSGTVEMLYSGPGTQLEKFGRTVRNFIPVYVQGVKEVLANFPQVVAGMSGLASSKPYGTGGITSDLSSMRPHQTSMAYTPWGQITKHRFDAPKIMQMMGLGDLFKKAVAFPAWMSSRSFQVIRGFESLVAGADKNIRWRTQMSVALMQADPKLSFNDAWRKVSDAMGDKTSEMWKAAQKQAKEDVSEKRISRFSESQRAVELMQDKLEDRWGSLDNRPRQMASLLNYKTDPITPLGSALYNGLSRALNSDHRILQYSRFGFLFARFFTNAIESAWSRTPFGGLTALMLPTKKKKLDQRDERIEQIFGSLSNYRDDRIARAISGTAAMTFLGSLMALALRDWDPESGDPPMIWVTGEPLGEYGKRSIMEAGGFYKPQTLYIGPLRLNYVNASPELAMALAAVGGIADRFMFDRLLNYKEAPESGEWEKDEFQAYVKPVLESMAAPVSRSTFRSFYDAIDGAFNGDFKKAARLISNPVVGTTVALSPAGAIPSFKTFEKMERVLDEPRSPRTAAQALAASIPFTDAGEILTTPFGETLSPFPFFSILSNTQQVSPERGKAARLLAELGIDARGPRTDYRVQGVTEISDGDKVYILNDTERDEVLQDIGKRFAASLNREADSLRKLLAEKEGRQKVRSRVTKLAQDAKSGSILKFKPRK